MNQPIDLNDILLAQDASRAITQTSAPLAVVADALGVQTRDVTNALVAYRRVLRIVATEFESKTVVVQTTPPTPARPTVEACQELLSLTDCAAVLRCSKRHVETLITTTRRKNSSPRLRTVRQGRRVYVTRQDLDRYVSGLRIEAGIR